MTGVSIPCDEFRYDWYDLLKAKEVDCISIGRRARTLKTTIEIAKMSMLPMKYLSTSGVFIRVTELGSSGQGNVGATGLSKRSAGTLNCFAIAGVSSDGERESVQLSLPQ